jgi:enamine deaminase RidA (YjgF/YER057c/UK114 family)
MLKNIEVRVRRSDHAQELYITARPAPGADAKCLFEQVAGVLREHNVFVLQERVFAQPSDVKNLRAARIAAFGDLVDGVEPTWLAVPPGAYGPIAGVQVHAVAGCTRPQVLSVDGEPCGRLATFLSNNTETGPERYLTGCNLQANVLDQKDQESLPADQAKGMLAKAESLLTQAGATFANVARTWMWLGKILDWYGEFNAVRNELFQARGLLASPAAKGRPSARIEAQDLLTREGNVVMPASTGIGIGPAVILDRVKKHCAMDFFASLGVPKMECLMAGGNQGSASKYGSAFSRAVVTKTPGGRTVYVSGTAAIDAAGHTTHLGDAAGQIADTIKNVRAVLKDGGCDQDDVVQTMVYCKTPQVERAFLDTWGRDPAAGRTPALSSVKNNWGDSTEVFPKKDRPRAWVNAQSVVAIADVCRDNLLFEIEATAMPRYN